MAAFTMTIAALKGEQVYDLDRRVSALRRILPDIQEDEPVPIGVWWSLPGSNLEWKWWSLRACEPAAQAAEAADEAARLALERAQSAAATAQSAADEAARMALVQGPSWGDPQTALDYADAARFAACAAAKRLESATALFGGIYCTWAVENILHAAAATRRAVAAARDVGVCVPHIPDEEAAQAADLERLFLGG